MNYELLENQKNIIQGYQKDIDELQQRIAELEKQKAWGIHHFTSEELAIRDLEQQAKGIELVLDIDSTSCLVDTKRLCNAIHIFDLNGVLSDLNLQIEQLKDQVDEL